MNIMDSYKQAMQQNYSWQQMYQKGVVSDTGITSGEGYNILASPQAPYVLTAAAVAQGAAPLYLNPSAALYSTGDQNRVLLSASLPQCDTGCVSSVDKPDPRVFQVKPLYSASVFKANDGSTLPTAYNVVGMY